ncbi:ATP-binding protein [uncultured Bacteroides sp.]|uniref:ATP-binding protein n=1 Tax=uncultured Bacteroides sp. TaxID=162156 RepID=UPI0037487CB7
MEYSNKNIADIFFKAGFIEAWGRGVSKIITGFTQEGLQAPKFEATMGGIMVTIIRKVIHQLLHQLFHQLPYQLPQNLP